MNAQPQVIIIEKETDGSTVIDVVQSLGRHHGQQFPTEENNIQATSMQFESLTMHNSVHHSSVQYMRHKLVSRLKAYS